MSSAEFEEREFETALYQQLRVGNNQVWSPGQVLENSVGFDYSAFCVDSYFWAIHGLQVPYDGIFLDEQLYRRQLHRRRINRPLPNFSLNLFIQAKRPEIKKTIPKVLKNQSLTLPYWRFKLDPAQQQTLQALAAETSGKCLVCYAAPAFDRLSQLYAHTRAGTIVAHTSFPDASWLSGHTAWNYDRPGAVGVANTDPVRIERPSLIERINEIVTQNAEYSNDGFDVQLGRLAEMVISRAEHESEVASLGRSSLFFQRVGEIDFVLEAYRVPRYDRAVRNFLIVLAFVDTYRLQWFVLGKAT